MVIELEADKKLEGHHAAIEEVREVLFVPFTLPRRGPDGRLQQEANPTIHFGMADTGAMVSCMTKEVLDAFPQLQPFFVPQADRLSGVGAVHCHVFGELRGVPVCMGPTQRKGQTILATFRVTEGAGYQIILGLDSMKKLRAVVDVAAEVFKFVAASGEVRRLRMYPRNTVRVQPVARLTQEHAKASWSPPAAH